MKFKSRPKILTILFVFLFAAVGSAAAQTIAAPQQEKLLNGMKLLVWNAPGDQKISVKLRIHSGAAFDTLGKEGTMSLLAEILFPTDAAREYFAEDLGGSLDVSSNYDYIQINAAANNDQFLTMLETLSNAVTRVQTDKETTAKVRAAHLEKLKELETNPSYIADRAAARRLFGDFPYGRPQMGTSESVARVDFADLTLAKQRFLTADNATLAVVGNVKPDLAYRAVRRYFGAWEKADKRVPATFRQPDAPDARVLTLEAASADKYLSRTAQMTAGRVDKDFYATAILAQIRRRQFCLDDESKRGALNFEPHLLRSVYTVAVAREYGDKIQDLPVYSGPCSLALAGSQPKIGQNEFEQAKAAAVSDLQQKTQTASTAADLWLDVDTFKLVSVKDEISKLNGVTLADVQRVADDLQKQPTVNVVVKKPETARKN